MAADDALIDQILDDRLLPPPLAGHRLARLDPGYRRAPGRVSELTPQHRLMIEYLVWGAKADVIAAQVGRRAHEPMTLHETADCARVRRRAARRLVGDPLFRKALAHELRVWRESRAGDAMRIVDDLMRDGGEGKAADRKVQLEAAKTMLGDHVAPANGQREINVNVGVQLQAGVVIKLKHADPPAGMPAIIEGEVMEDDSE